MNTDNSSCKAYNKSNSGSKENENRKKQKEIINLTVMFKGEKYIAFPGLQKITAFGQVSAAVLPSAEFFDYGFVWKLATVALCYNVPCLQQKNYIHLSSSYLFMQICDALFLASGGFCDIKTLPCSECTLEEQSKPNLDSEAHISYHI